MLEKGRGWGEGKDEDGKGGRGLGKGLRRAGEGWIEGDR